MKIAKRDIALLLIVFGLLIGFCAYKFFLSEDLKAVEDEEATQGNLQFQIDEVKARADQVPKMEKEIGEWQTIISNWLKPFHCYHQYEDAVMYLRNLEHQNEKDKDPFELSIYEYKLEETGINTTITGQGSFAGTSFSSGTANYEFKYEIKGYDQLKYFLTYMISEEDGFGVKSLDSMSFDLQSGSDVFRGTITMTAYAIAEVDGGKLVNPYVPQKLDDIEQGLDEKDSIFGNFKEEDETDKNKNNNNN